MPKAWQDGQALMWRGEGETIRVEAYGPDVLRVRGVPAGAFSDEPFALLDPLPAEPVITITDEQISIRNGLLEATLGAKKGELTFRRTDTGELLLAEKPIDALRPQREYRCLSDGDLRRLSVRFDAYAGEKLFGLGQHPNGTLDQKHQVIDLAQYNTDVVIPFLLSSRGYGLLWNNPSQGRVEMTEFQTRWVSDGSYQVDYLVLTAPGPAGLLERYTALTGRSPMLPEWAAGFWQCKLRYHSQEQVRQIVRKHVQELGLPMSVMVLDYFHWTKMGEYKFDESRWPDPEGLVQELAELGVKLVVSVWPTVSRVSEVFQPMSDQGLLLRTNSGVLSTTFAADTGFVGRPYQCIYDPSNPDARAFVWSRIREGYYQRGVKAFWLDACEPEMHPPHYDNLRYHAGPGVAVSSQFPKWHQQTFYEGLRGEGEPDGEILTLGRSAWAGSQRYAAAVWSGDIPSTFDSLRRQVRAGLNLMLCGIPWWTTDIGGFNGGVQADEGFRELLIRWFQYGVFCPLFRLHGIRKHEHPWGFDMANWTGGDNEVWSYGEQAFGILREQLFLRERLRPYVMEQMKRASESGLPPMRPVWFDFPQDASAWTVEDEFLFGPDILVAPVTEAGAASREVYLPAGATWTDAWTGEAHPGGQTLTAAAPLERIPVYLRDGADLPIRG